VLISLVLLIVLGLALFALTFTLQSRSKPPVAAVERRDSRVEPAPMVASPPAAAPVAAQPSQPLAPVFPVPASKPTAPSTASPEVKPAVAAPTAPAGSPGIAAAPIYRLVARAKETTWVRVRTEDGRVTEETMSAGDVREWVSNRRFVLTIGNAGGVALELNGQSLPPLGPSGVVIPQIVIPPDRQ
jgi:cytoskeleton protein RodZ